MYLRKSRRRENLRVSVSRVDDMMVCCLKDLLMDVVLVVLVNHQALSVQQLLQLVTQRLERRRHFKLNRTPPDSPNIMAPQAGDPMTRKKTTF